MSTSTPSFEQRAGSIALQRPARYHVHETVFRQMLGFQTTDDPDDHQTNEKDGGDKEKSKGEF